jgi:RHS repeat-associated protein
LNQRCFKRLKRITWTLAYIFIDTINPNFSLTDLNYDGLNRLTNTTGGTSIGSSAMAYDALGNITSYSNSSNIKPSSLTYTYNTSTNKLTGVSGNSAAGYDFSQSNSYDTRGNVTNNGMRSFSYNLANQMTHSGGNSYVYDGYNRRVKTQDCKGTSYSMYSQSGRLLYREVNGKPVSYIFLGDKLIAKEGIMPASTNSRMHYKPFGASIEQAKDEVGYTGHKFDTDLGLSYMQARYYDPVIGRFYSNDPVGFKNVHNFNRYAYANNNPYKYVDPDGREIKSIQKDVIRKDGQKISETEIKFTGVMIDRTGTLSTDQLKGLASQMTTQIESSFTGSSDDASWSTKAIIDVGSANTPLNSRHEINIQASSSFPVEGALGSQKGSKINLLNTLTKTQFNRTSAHEFGHAGGLNHYSGGLMTQSKYSKSLEISGTQIKLLHIKNQ